MTEAVHHQKSTRRRRTQAVLAGGIVLGIGAAVTLATWSDSEFAEGIFGSGSFNLEGSTDGGSYSDHPTEDAAATLSFSADSMIPGETVYASLSVRLDEDTTVGGTIESDDGIAVVESEGDNLDHLSYTVYADPQSCSAGEASTGDAVASGSDLSEGVGSDTTISLSTGSGDSAGEPVMLCFAVTADPDDLQQSGSTNVIWQVTATSSES